MKSTSSFPSDRAARHLSALCHHFGRKVEALAEGDAGWVQFPFGRCEMTAADGALTLIATAQDAARLEQVQRIVTSHIERFAFRDEPHLSWQPLPDNA